MENFPPRSQDPLEPSSPPQVDSQLLSTHWISPLPPPGTLLLFNQVIPDGANRIMLMIEQELAHRIAHESRALGAAITDFRRGHWLGVGFGALSVLAAAVTAYFGAHPTVSIALVGLPLAAVIQNIVSRR